MESIQRPVAVARLIIPDAEGRVLILRRGADSAGGGLWCLPGGKVDYGETIEAAAARELFEETGLRSSGLRFLFYQDSLPLAAGEMHCINFYFECGAEGEVALSAESVASAWAGCEELAGFTVAFRNDEGLAKYWAESGK